MRPWHCLVELEPLDPIAGQRVTLRIASASLREITGLGGERGWVPAMVQPPSTSLTLFDGSLSNAVRAGSARLPIALGALRRRYPNVDDLFWSGAKVTIYAGRVGDAWPWQRHFVGRVTGPTRDKDVLALACDVDQEPFTADVLTAAYAGTLGAEGSADLKERVKPLVIGRAQNVEPVLIDVDNSVYQFSAYGPIERVETLYERAASFGPAGANYGSYEALVAASIPRGGWATCLARGMVRLGAPAAGVITGDVRGHTVSGTTPRYAGAMIAALANIAGVPASLIAIETLAAMDVARPFPTGLVLDQQTDFLSAAQRLALPCNYQAGISLTGRVFACGIRFVDAAPAFELHAQGNRRPQVLDSNELAVSPPYGRTVLGAARAWRVHTAEEIAFDAPLIDRGLYDPTATYRTGNYVTLPDKSKWLYVATLPSSGNAPPTWPQTENAWWSNMEPPVGAGDIKYGNGDTLEDMKPAAPGADVTGDNTSKDTDNVGGRPAENVLAVIDDSKRRQDIMDKETVPAINGAIGDAFEQVADARDRAVDARERAGAARQLAADGHTRTDALTDRTGEIEAEVTRITIAYTDADKSLAEETVRVEATLNETINAKVEETKTAFADADAALAEETNRVEASIGPAINAKAEEITTAYTDADVQLAQQASNLETGAGELSSRVSNVETAVTDGRFATALRAQIIEASVDNAIARLSTVETATTDGRFAAVQRVETLEATVGGFDARITEQAGVIADVNGRTGVYWQVEGTTPDGSTRIALSKSNGERGLFYVGADMLIDGNLSIINGSIFTEQIAAGSITTPYFYESADVFCQVGVTTTVMEMPTSLPIGDANGGGCVLMLLGEIDSVNQSDLGLELRIFADTGAGFQQVAVNKGGILTVGANTRFDLPISLAHALYGAQVRVRVTARPYIVSGASDTRPAWFRNTKLIIFGGKR